MGIQKRHVMVFFLSAALILSTHGESQSTPVVGAAPNGGTARSFLEGKFENFLNTCTGASTLHSAGRFFGHPQHNIPAIPALILVNDADLLDKLLPVVPAIGNDIGATFNFVIPDSSKTSGVVDLTDPSRALNPDKTFSDAPSSLAGHFSSVAYSNTCGELVDATVKGNAQAAFPLVNLKAMLSYQYDKKQTSQIVVALGAFDSPFQIGVSPLPESLRLYRDFLIWGWYGKNPAEMNNTNWMYSRLLGLAYYKTINVTTQGSLNGSIAGSVTAPFASLSGSVSSQIDQSGVGSVLDAQTLPFLPVADSEYVKLPSPDILVTDVKDIKLAPYSPPPSTPGTGKDTSTVLIAGQSYDFYQKISGLPSAWCDSGQWPDTAIMQTSPPTNLALVEVSDATQDPQNSSLCIFHFQLNPKQSIDPSVNPSLNVSFAIQNTLSNGVASKAIALHSSDFTINVSKSPTFVSQFPNAIPTVGVLPGNGHTLLQWVESIAIDDTDNPIQSIAQPTVFSLTCGTNTTPLPGVKVAVSWQSTPNKLLTITPSYEASDPTQLDVKSASATVACTLSVNLVFNMTTGNAVTKTQTFSINTYPPVSQSTTPGAAPVAPGH